MSPTVSGFTLRQRPVCRPAHDELLDILQRLGMGVIPRRILYVALGEKNMKKIISLVAACLVSAAAEAHADPLMKYNYLDVAYQWNTMTAFKDVEPTNGLDTKLSISPIENFAIEGGYNYAYGKYSKEIRNIFDFNPSALNYNTYSYGILGYLSYCKGLDFLLRVGGNHFDTTNEIAGQQEASSYNGVYAGAGSRYLATDDLELDANVLYQSNDLGGRDTAVWTYSGTALYAILDNVALKGDVGINNGSSVTLTAGVRVAM